jgi:hypothetical protein
MPPTEQANQQFFNNLLLPHNHLRELADDLFARVPQFANGRRIQMPAFSRVARHALVLLLIVRKRGMLIVMPCRSPEPGTGKSGGTDRRPVSVQG